MACVISCSNNCGTDKPGGSGNEARMFFLPSNRRRRPELATNGGSLRIAPEISGGGLRLKNFLDAYESY